MTLREELYNTLILITDIKSKDLKKIIDKVILPLVEKGTKEEREKLLEREREYYRLIDEMRKER